ncbi:MAG: copper-translocating P-type ATPase, partial [Thermoleophilia bacterium]|nr:copper-translocating P-type ATPase [Thermoleophilia bacterium]
MKPLPMIQPAAAPPVDDCCATGACAAPSTESSPVGEVDASSALSVLRIDGMDCASCAVTLERVVRATPGVDRAVVNFATARLDVHHGAGIDAAGLAAAVARAGFSVRPAA